MGRIRAVSVVAAVSAACGRIHFASLGDASALGDGAPNDSAVGFCAAHATATFCSDFDDGRGLAAWNGSNQLNGTVSLDGNEVSTAPYALSVAVTSLTSSQTADVDLVETGLPSATSVAAQFAVRIDLAGTSDAVLFKLDMNDGAEIHSFEIVSPGAGTPAYVEDVNTPMGMAAMISSFGASSAISFGAWHQVQLDFTAGASAHLTVELDGTSIVDTAPTYTTGGATTAAIGIPYLSGSATPWQAHFDDFAVTVQ